MTVKSTLKRMLGFAANVDTYEKLTEYSIAARALPLDRSELVKANGKTWDELVGHARHEIWRRLVDRIEAEDVLFLEFGVWKGESIRKFAELLPSPGSRLYGFDSFVGLPEIWRGQNAGHFNVNGNIPRIDDDRVSFVKGWFRDSLPGKMDELTAVAQGKALLVNFDADLYSSTLYVLFKLAERFDGFYFVFDEFSGHEIRALYNFCQATGATTRFFNHLMWKGCPTVVSGHLTIPAPKPRSL